MISKQYITTKTKLKLINVTAIMPNFSFHCKHSNVSHLYHRIHEVLEEQSLIKCILPHQVRHDVLDSIISYQLAVTSQQCVSSKEVHVIQIIEPSRSFNVERHQIIIMSLFGAIRPQQLEVFVLPHIPYFFKWLRIVQALLEACAP